MNQSKGILRLFNLALMLLPFLVFPAISHAACHVIIQGGSGTKSGSDWSNAMAALPGSLVRGDTYYVGPGKYGNHNFNDADSSASLIQVRATTATDHCTDTGWNATAMVGQAMFSCSSKCGAILTFTTDYYTFTGQYCTSMTSVAVCNSGYGFLLDNTNGNAGVAVQGGFGYNGPPDLDHDINVQYAELNGAHPTSDASTLDVGVDFEGGSYNLLFDHLFVHDDWVPFFIKGNHGHQNGGGYVFGSGDNITIQNSYWSHNYSSSAHHSEGCSCSEGLTNFTIRNNYIADMVGTAYIATPSGASYNSGNGPNGPWMIYGNVFMATATGRSSLHCGTGDGMLAAFDTTFSGDVYFLNNTIAGLSGCQAYNNGLGFGLAFTTPMQHLYFENNLFWNTDSVTVIPTGTTSWNGATLTGVNSSYTTWSQVPDSSASTDTDANKQILSSDPFINSSSANWMLARDTTAGTSTHALLAGNDFDMNGVARGSNGVWDRGALQIAATQNAPPAPTSLTAVPY